jgi:hypothetical protein
MVQEDVSKKIKAFKHYYTVGIQKEENKLNKIKSTYSNLPSYAKTMGDLRQISENEQVSQIVTNNNLMQKKSETTKDGIIRKATPIYQLPEPEHLFDMRAQFYAPMKHFMGKFFPTETFNIFIIWMFTLFTGIVLKFRLLRFVLKTGKG